HQKRKHGPRRGTRRVLEHVTVPEGNVASCGVYVDLGRFNRDPHAISAVEPELAHGGRCYLGYDRRRAGEADAHAITLQIQVDGSALPDVARRAIRARAIERDGTRMDDGKHIAVRGPGRRQRSTAGKRDDVAAGAAAEEIDPDQVGHIARAWVLRDVGGCARLQHASMLEY